MVVNRNDRWDTIRNSTHCQAVDSGKSRYFCSLMSVQNAYNAWSSQYDTNHNKTRDLDQRVTIDTLSQYSFETVLELGCGTGKNTAWLVDRAKAIRALDFSEGMLQQAVRKINDQKVTFQFADLTLPWDVPAAFGDLVTSSLTLEHIQNLDFIFHEAADKLKPGGHFFVCELHPFKQYAGSKARFESEGKVTELEVYVHHISDYLNAASTAGLELVELREWFDEEGSGEIPRLISFVFRK